jgi:N-alpha-acetyl-L-2,4-diaminobutyrate deacetylase
MRTPHSVCFTISEDAGLWEVLTDLGAPVSKRQLLGQIHFPQRPQTDPVVYRSRIGGTLIGRRHKVLVSPRDFLALVAVDL